MEAARGPLEGAPVESRARAAADKKARDHRLQREKHTAHI